MSKTNETTVEALQAELEALRAKNLELLAEAKNAKAAARDATVALEAAQGDLEATRGQVRSLRLDGPVEAMLGRVAMPGASDVFAALFGRHYQFELGDDGPVILTANGEPATLPTKDGTRPALFTEGDLSALAQSCPSATALDLVIVGSRAGGGGAPGSRLHSPPEPRKPESTQPQPAPYGLR